MPRAMKLFLPLMRTATMAVATELPSKNYLNLAAIKTMVAAAEAEAKKRDVEVTMGIVDESGNLLYFQKADGASLNTIEFAQKKARHAAAYGKPSKHGAEKVKSGSVEALAFPNFFPNQGALPILYGGQLLGGMAASGAKSEFDEAIARAGTNGLWTI
jgi:glc operon protein GlcG